MNKKIIYLLFLILAISGIQLQAQPNEYCNELAITQYLNISCGEWENKDDIVMVVMGCTITIKYQTRLCSYVDPNCFIPRPLLQVNVTGIYWDDLTCNNLMYNLFPGYPNNFSQLNVILFEQMFAQANETAATQAFTDYYNSLQTQSEKDQYNCDGTPPNCTFPQEGCNNIEVIASNPTCQIVCWGVRNGLGTNGEPYIFFNYLPCDDNGESCCVKIMKFCICDTTVKKTVIFNGPATNVCENALPPEIECIPVSGYTMYDSGGCIILCP